MITYSEIRNMQRRERETTSLQDIGGDFIEKFSEYLKDKKEIVARNKDESNPFAAEMEKKAREEMENALKVVDSLFQLREKKIIYQAILSAKKDIKIYNTSNMLKQEKELFENVLDIIRKHRKRISQEISSSEKIKKEEKVLKTIKFNDSIASFVWKEEKYGPYEIGEEVQLPEELAELFIERGKAEEVVKNENP